MPEALSFQVLGLELAGQRWNAGAALPVLALHGWLDNSESFAAMASHMPDVDLVALDMAGHGWSDHRALHANYLIWDDLREILAVAEQLGWQRFGVLGHSRGAIVAALLAAACPERVTALGLIDGLWAQTKTATQVPSQLGKALALSVPPGDSLFISLEDMVALRLRSGLPLGESAALSLVRRNAIESKQGWRWRSDARLKWPSLMMLTPEQELALHQAIRAPVRLVLADAGLVLAYPDYGSRLSALPQVEWSIQAGGHHLHMEEGQQSIADVFNAFFVKVGPAC